MNNYCIYNDFDFLHFFLQHIAFSLQLKLVEAFESFMKQLVSLNCGKMPNQMFNYFFHIFFADQVLQHARGTRQHPTGKLAKKLPSKLPSKLPFLCNLFRSLRSQCTATTASPSQTSWRPGSYSPLCTGEFQWVLKCPFVRVLVAAVECILLANLLCKSCII